MKKKETIAKLKSKKKKKKREKRNRQETRLTRLSRGIKLMTRDVPGVNEPLGFRIFHRFTFSCRRLIDPPGIVTTRSHVVLDAREIERF